MSRSHWYFSLLALPCLWLAACSNPATTDSEEDPFIEDPYGSDVATSGGTDGVIQLKILTPESAKTAPETIGIPAISGVTKISGSIVVPDGVTLVPGGVTAQFSPHVVAGCTVSDVAFECDVDTTVHVNGVADIACNEIVTMRVVAQGKRGGKVVEGKAQAFVEVDNCLPAITIDAPPSPGPTAKWGVTATVSDARLVGAEMTVTDQNGKNLLSKPLVKGPNDSSTTWTANYFYDPNDLNEMSYLRVTVTASDQSNPEYTVERLVARLPTEGFGFGIGDVFMTDKAIYENRPFGIINDIAVATRDNAPTGFASFYGGPKPTELGTVDNLADVVIAAEDGIYVRPGYPYNDTNGNPVDKYGQALDGDAQTYVHALAFQTFFWPNPMAEGYFIDLSGTGDGLRGPRGVKDKVARMDRVFLRDLDGDGDLDIVSVGALPPDPLTGKLFTGVWAILNQTRHRKMLVALPDHSFVEKTVVVRTFKKLAKIQIVSDATPAPAAMADLNGDGVDDLILGIHNPEANIDERGLMVMTVNPKPTCTTKDGQVVSCEVYEDEAATADIFPSGYIHALNIGVTNITSITTGDFFAGGGTDVCVGEAKRPIVSCYRNSQMDGTLEQAVDSVQLVGEGDSEQILAVEYTAKNGSDGTDLLVSPAFGSLRWLKGDHAGGFTYADEGQPGHRLIAKLAASHFVVAPVGEGGSQQVLASVMKREVQEIPLDPDDDSHVRMCYRGWVPGLAAKALTVGRIDADDALDLIVADERGVQISLAETVAGKANGNFLAPNAYHLCGEKVSKISRGLSPIRLARVGKFAPGKQHQLLMFGPQTNSVQAGANGNYMDELGAIFGPLHVWPFEVFANADNGLNPTPRRGEFSPFHAKYAASAGLADGFGELGVATAAKLGDLNGDGVDELVVVRDLGYSAGGGKPGKTCDCTFSELHEVDSWFGESSAPTAASDPNKCCINYLPTDPAFTPLVGFGGGAPLHRASALVFSSSASGPLGMGKQCVGGKPLQAGDGVCTFGASFGFAGGINPVAVALADVDGDKDLDIITGMNTQGKNCYPPGSVPTSATLLQARVRAFENVGNLKFAPTFVTNLPAFNVGLDTIQVHNCMVPTEVAEYPVSYRVMADGLVDILTGPWANPLTGLLDAATIFGLSSTYGQAAVMPHVSGFAYGPVKLYPFGSNGGQPAVGDFNEDGLQDFAVLADEGHAIVVMVGNFVDATHKEASFFQQWALVIAPKDGPQQPIAVSVGVGDFNHDGHQDLITLRGSPAWQIEVWLGSGTGSFSRVGGRFVPPDSTGVQVADIDGDGCDDLVVTSALTTTVLHNEGSISGSCPGGSLWSHFLLPKE